MVKATSFDFYYEHYTTFIINNARQYTENFMYTQRSLT